MDAGMNTQRKALVVGGGNGIGLAMVLKLLKGGYEKVYVVDKNPPKLNDIDAADRALFEERTQVERVNLLHGAGDVFRKIRDIDTLVITVGFGRVAPFESLVEREVENLIKVNFQSVVNIIHQYYDKIAGAGKFHCAVMGSIAGFLASPLFSVYGASKAGLCAFLENINAELIRHGSPNRILNISPGSLKGTAFSGGENQLAVLDGLCGTILEKMYAGETLFIPDYEEVFKGVIARYREDPVKFALESYDYKLPRISGKPQMVIGYMSGTFDLFHIGHLNILRRAKEQCDFLIVGVHRSGKWKGKETYISHEERIDIVRNIRYVDLAIESYPEDMDAYHEYHYDKLFVGSDYKGSERFNRYEEYFRDKGVEIVYFPYTKGTSSTQLRAAISQ